MTENKNNLNNDNTLPLFEGYKEDKKTNSTLNPKTANIKLGESKAAGSTIEKETKKVAKKSITSPVSNKTTLGPYLQEARVKAGYSIHQVAMVTKLNTHYIEALERDDYKHTPPFIYMKAYAKKLCSVYNIDEEKALSLLKPLDNAEANVTDTIIQDLHETKQTNKEDEKKIKFIAKITIIAFSLIFILCIILGLCFWPSDSSTANKPLTAKEKAQTAKNMEKLITPQSISLTKLPIKQK